MSNLKEMPVVTVEQVMRFREAALAQIADLQSRLAAAEADAERYRWLRDRGDDCQWQNLLRVEVDEFESIDEAIDKARGAGDE